VPTDGLQRPVPPFSALVGQTGEVCCLNHYDVLPISFLMSFFNQHSQRCTSVCTQQHFRFICVHKRVCYPL
jgi:hypothetical protein